MFCCEVFRGLTEAVGQSGFSVVARDDGGLRYFCLQARTFDQSQRAKMNNVPRDCNLPRPFLVEMQIGIQYCPFCGFSLQALISEHSEEFDRLVIRDKSFLI